MLIWDTAQESLRNFSSWILYQNMLWTSILYFTYYRILIPVIFKFIEFIFLKAIKLIKFKTDVFVFKFCFKKYSSLKMLIWKDRVQKMSYV